jgi:4-diphosphocytidyl-2-C-methyl-D-erythritol kinase
MGERVRVLAPAKVNLHLEVFPPREDGYHPILSLFQSISWFDELELCSLKEKNVCEIEGEVVHSEGRESGLESGSRL